METQVNATKQHTNVSNTKNRKEKSESSALRMCLLNIHLVKAQDGHENTSIYKNTDKKIDKG